MKELFGVVILIIFMGIVAIYFNMRQEKKMLEEFEEERELREKEQEMSFNKKSEDENFVKENIKMTTEKTQKQRNARIKGKKFKFKNKIKNSNAMLKFKSYHSYLDYDLSPINMYYFCEWLFDEINEYLYEYGDFDKLTIDLDSDDIGSLFGDLSTIEVVGDKIYLMDKEDNLHTFNYERNDDELNIYNDNLSYTIDLKDDMFNGSIVFSNNEMNGESFKYTEENDQGEFITSQDDEFDNNDSDGMSMTDAALGVSAIAAAATMLNDKQEQEEESQSTNDQEYDDVSDVNSDTAY